MSFVKFMVENWSSVVVVICVFILIYFKVKSFLKLSKEDQKKAILSVVKKYILNLMADAELNWEDYKKAGKAKSAEVIDNIYKQFPELVTLADQEAVLATIQSFIEANMEELRKIMESKKEEINVTAAPVITTTRSGYVAPTDPTRPVVSTAFVPQTEGTPTINVQYDNNGKIQSPVI